MAGMIKSGIPLRLLADEEKARDFYKNIFNEPVDRNSG
jgi:hypothetical protein